LFGTHIGCFGWRIKNKKKQPVYYKFLQCGNPSASFGTFLLLFRVSPEKYLFSFSVPTSKQRRKACFLLFYATVDTSPMGKISRLFLGTSGISPRCLKITLTYLLRFMNGSLCVLFPFWLKIVITLVLIKQHLLENRSTDKFVKNELDIK